MELTQDCNDSVYADHVGSGRNAWDFANGTNFPVSVARGGVVTHLKISSGAGCDTPACVDLANYVVIDHGDGSASVYLHLEGDSLDPMVRCGQPVRQGQRLASAGSTGWSTGPHLHFQVNSVHAGESLACECGERGQDCAAGEAAWTSFWSSPRYPSLPVEFDEWAASECSDRRIMLPLSQNLEAPLGSPALPLFDRRVAGQRSAKPLILLGGGRHWAGTSINDRSRPLLPGILPPSAPAPFSARPPR
jgi:murein DD-endopeptidase MepM/ murein hydrolase activator NlpD